MPGRYAPWPARRGLRSAPGGSSRATAQIIGRSPASRATAPDANTRPEDFLYRAHHRPSRLQKGQRSCNGNALGFGESCHIRCRFKAGTKVGGVDAVSSVQMVSRLTAVAHHACVQVPTGARPSRPETLPLMPGSCRQITPLTWGSDCKPTGSGRSGVRPQYLFRAAPWASPGV